MPNMQDANNLLCLVHFVENPIDVLAFSEEKTSDFPACFLCFTSNGTTVRKFLQGVQKSMSSENHSGPLIGERSSTQS